MSRRFSRRKFLASTSLAGAGALAISRAGLSADVDDPVAPWQAGVKISPVSQIASRHTMHTYYLLNPESPDGRKVLFFASTDPAGHVGQICILDRQTGAETVLADDIHTEDAHRVALQQWTANGQAVAYHEVVDKRWRVFVVDIATRQKKIVAEDRQLGFGRSDGHVLPLYGCHWNPGQHRDLELYDLATGQLSTAVKIGDVEQNYGDWLNREFAGKSTSIAFPTLSPDQKRVFFKLSAGNGGVNFMSKDASHRQGVVFYDLQRQRLTCMREKWGHPAWHPDSFHWIEMGNLLFDANGGPVSRIPTVPALRGQHLSVSPCGKLFVSDGLTETLGGPPGEWAVLVANLRGQTHAIVQKFVGNRGAKSWRVSHPHPVFSADSRRIYYNINAGQYTQLHVAELAS
jgi:Tol biopolymer transport system component